MSYKIGIIKEIKESNDINYFFIMIILLSIIILLAFIAFIVWHICKKKNISLLNKVNTADFFQQGNNSPDNYGVLLNDVRNDVD